MFRFYVKSICLLSIPVCPHNKAQQSHPPTNFYSPGQGTTCWLHDLPRQHTFCFGLHRLSQFCHFTFAFESEHVCICFILMFYVFPSQCAHHCINHILYDHSHTHHIPQATTREKDRESYLHHIYSLHHNDLNHHIHQHVRNYHLAQETMFQKDKTIRPDHHPKEKPTHTQSVHFYWFQVKETQKILPPIHTPQN